MKDFCSREGSNVRIANENNRTTVDSCKRKFLNEAKKLIAEGRIKEITKWLNTNIHQYGNTRTPKEVIEAVCHKEVSAKPLIKYFTEKYSEIYNLAR